MKLSSVLFGSCLFLCATTFAQRADSARLAKMSPPRLTEYYTRYGYRTSTGNIVKPGGTIQLIKGTGKKDRFETVYCAPHAHAIGISTRSKRNLSQTPKSFAGTKAYVFEIWAIGTRRYGHRVVVWAGGIKGWCDVWIDIEDALKLGEVKIVEQ